MIDDSTRTDVPGADPAAHTRAEPGATGFAPFAEDDLSPPPAPPGFDLLDEVGRGGMGVVYRARELALNRLVAIKVLQDRFPPDNPAVARFLEEAQITAQLQHHGIPPVHQSGTLPDGRPFLVMKLIKGHTLGQELKARANPAADRGRFLAVFEQVCQAVACAHEHQVIHRDLKPSNVMVGAFGEVQVMDWGLAKPLAAPAARPVGTPASGSEVRTLRDTGGTYTQAGSMMGTPAYMPPEQAGGEIDKVDERADVFGLGAILCVVLTGEPPYTAADDDGDVVRLMAIRGQLDAVLARLDGCGAEPGWVALAKRCLAADAADRPRHAGEVAKAVAGLRAAADERARRAELDRAKARVREAEQRKRRKVQAALAITGVALVALAGLGLWRSERLESERAQRRSRTVASIAAALEDARVRTDEAWALADEPDKMRVSSELAVAAVHRAEGFAEAGEAPPAALDELAGVRATVADLDRHTRLFVAADQALRAHDVGAAGQPAGHITSGRLAGAFADFGWDPVNTPADAIADEIAASRVRNKVLGFLCDWEFQSSQNRLVQGQVREVIRAARLRSGAQLAEWQRVKDAGTPAALVEFAAGPDVLTLGPELLCALSRDLRGAGRHDADLALLRRAADRYPAHVWLNFDLSNACGSVRPPRLAEALRAASAAATARPDSALLRLNLGTCFESLGELDLAAESYRKAVALAPTYGSAYRHLAAVLTRAGDVAGMVTAYAELARQNPRDADTLNRVAWLLAAGPDGVRDGPRAVEAATRACELSGWRNALYIDTLAAACAEAGDFHQAVAYQKKALTFPGFERAYGRVAREHLAQFQQRQPVRDPQWVRRAVAPPPRPVRK
jgi:tetratricopeptide (TPR) repeat protein